MDGQEKMKQLHLKKQSKTETYFIILFLLLQGAHGLSVAALALASENILTAVSKKGLEIQKPLLFLLPFISCTCFSLLPFLCEM